MKNKFVRVIIENHDNQFLIVNQLKGGVNFPGGKMEEDESVEDAARRELFEETGLVVSSLKLVQKSLFRLGDDDWSGYFLLASSYKGELINKEPKKIKEVAFKDHSWLQENASKTFVLDILNSLPGKTKNSLKMKY
jgi:8-oxo-dGTP pyrophosphatase MutT (NUDIX family)